MKQRFNIFYWSLLKLFVLMIVVLGLNPLSWADPDAATANVAEGNPAWVNQGGQNVAQPNAAWDNQGGQNVAQPNVSAPNTVEGEDAQGNPAWVNDAGENVSQPNVDIWQNY